MKCCEECPEYDVCDEKTGCCDMCDFYSPKTKKCAYIKKKKKTDKDEVLSRKKVEDEDKDPLDEEGINDLEEDYEETDPYEDDNMEDFFNT